MLKILLLPAFFAISFAIYAQQGEWGKIIEVSRTKKSLIFNKGTLNGLEENEEGFFITRKGKDFVKVAKGKIVRALPGKSFWYLSTIYSPELLSENLYLIQEKELLRGRKKEEESHNLVILPNGQTPVTYQDIPEKIRHKEKDYREGADLSIPPVRSQKEIKVTHYSSWLDQGLRAVENYEDVVEVKGIEKKELSQESDLLLKQRKNETALGTLEGLISKEDFLDAPPSDQKIIRMKEREGPLWSADLDDRQLRRYMLEAGMVEEKKRQEFALENRFMDELLFNFAYQIKGNESSNPTDNMASPYAISIGYEYHFMRIARALDPFSFTLIFEGGVDYYDVGGFNARGKEWSLLGNFNWYFLSLPSATEKLLGYVGVGFRYGETNLVANELSTSYPYQLLALPTLELGFKYRFPTSSNEDGFGWGVNLYMNYLKTQLNVLVDLQDDIYGTIYDDEVRLNAGLTFTF
jgi:hypothetical protein